MDKNKHTFVVLAYKESLFLPACLQSLQHQTVPSEIIITTSTPVPPITDIAAEFKVPVVVNPQALGIADDWSFGYRYARTPWVTLVHQDDIYLPGYIQECERLIAQKGQDDLLFLFTDYSELLDDGKIRSRSLNLIIKKILLWPYLFSHIVRCMFLKRMVVSFGDPISCPSVMFHKKLIGPFEFDREYVCNMDWDAWLRIIPRDGSMGYVKKRLMMHRIHSHSQTSVQIQRNVRFQEDRAVFERLWPPAIARIFAYLYAFCLRSNTV